jgi:acetoin utilization protein AcuC
VTVTVVWDDALLAYDLGDHPLNPVRCRLTVALARRLGVLDRDVVEVAAPSPVPEEMLLRVHTPEYVDAVRRAPTERWQGALGHELGSPDNPVFDGMHEAAALVCGASALAAERVATGAALHAVNIAGGLHHAMPDHAWGFCVYNDPAVAILTLLDAGFERVAYVDVDVHHGDGVQAIFWDDPRVLTVSLHQDPRTIFPGRTGYPDETGGAAGTAINVALPPGTDDQRWLRAFDAVVPAALRSFRPSVLVTQQGCDSHRDDLLGSLALTVDGQHASYAALHELAHELCEGRWVALGGGGYGLANVVPRAWTRLLAEATGDRLDPATPLPDAWRAEAAELLPGWPLPETLTDGGGPRPGPPWQPDSPDPADRAALRTRRAVWPLLGLDPDDPRD